MNEITPFESFHARILRKHPKYKFSWEIYTELVLERVRQKPYWLDIGAGSNIWIKEQPGAELAVGLDVAKPESLHLGSREAYCLAVGENLPFRSESFDFVTAHYVVEHLEAPLVLLAEISRVLKPSAVFLLQTTNKNNPLVILARLIPFAVKKRLFKALFAEIPAGIYKTHYRLNSPAQFPQRAGNLELVSIQMVEDILTHNRVFFEISLSLMGILDRYRLDNLKGNIIAVYKKPPPA